MFNHKNKNLGFVAIYITILVLVIIFAITISIYILIYGEQKISRDVVKSREAYYIAEAGIEDAVYRLRNPAKGFSSNPYTISVGNGSVEVYIDDSDPFNQKRIVTATSNINNFSRKLRVYLTMNDLDNPAFFYGVQAGDLGIVMYNGAKIIGKKEDTDPGNVYSNGPVIGITGAGKKPIITGNVSSVTSIENIDIGTVKWEGEDGDARADSITNSNICGKAYYQSLLDFDSTTFLNSPGSPCQAPYTPGSGIVEAPPPAAEMPIPESIIDNWKDDAAKAKSGVINGNYEITDNNITVSLGPKKIYGDLVINATGVKFILTGIVYVTGNIDIRKPGAKFSCASSFGEDSCILMADGWIGIKNNADFQGSGDVGGKSHMLVLGLSDCVGTSPSNCTENADSAIHITNVTTGAIYYAKDGAVLVEQSINVKEITGRKIILLQGSTVAYEKSLSTLGFSSGPGNSWKIQSWEEIE